MDHSGERVRLTSCVEDDQRHGHFAQMQLMNDTVAWLAGEVSQQRFARSSALAGYLVFRGAERPHLLPRRRIRRLKWAAAENKAEVSLADAGVSH